VLENPRLIGLSQDFYMIQRYGKVASEAGNVKRNYVQQAIPDGKMSVRFFSFGKLTATKMTIPTF
jgi:hypothetical protein